MNSTLRSNGLQLMICMLFILKYQEKIEAISLNPGSKEQFLLV